MEQDPQGTDEKIRLRLKAWSEKDADYWSFRGRSTRKHLHAYFQYPAMMVPQMQGALIDAIVDIVPGTKSLYEPFIGSGTVMTEAMKYGLDIYGQDINPLAVLLCRTKSGPFYSEAAKDRIEQLKSRIQSDGRCQIEADFPGLKKWFKDDVACELSKIRRAIRSERFLWCRRFFWVALAETIRLTSNSRTSTYKLHIRSDDDIQTRCLSPIEMFTAVLEKNLEYLSEKKGILKARHLLRRGKYIGKVDIRLKDSSLQYDVQQATGQQTKQELHDILVSSPPYGDNRTTISYGQNAYLPLQWIDLEDIDEGLGAELLTSSYEIDRRSLGGSLTKKIVKEAEELLDVSKSLKETIENLKGEPEDRQNRVAAFYRDLSRCIDPTLKALKPHAYMIWTVGNRRVAGRLVPMDKILAELITYKGAEFVESFERLIPSKRMAVKAGDYMTIRAETIIVMRRTESKGNAST
ncbi:MAG: hypothetical protein QOG71_1715 [Pyrinomonadaceae bacterium]|nr:hypothetical protein [Pyrinomonadaceae bacterium]